MERPVVEGWGLDGFKPDKGDVVGTAVALAGVLTIMLWPRETTSAAGVGGGGGGSGNETGRTGLNHHRL